MTALCLLFFSFPALSLPIECVYWGSEGNKLLAFLGHSFLDLEESYLNPTADCVLSEDLDL